ncbi:helix-turn-helix domain-containing protein [Streptomyces acidiscabies]|uniref:Helix-turn-helix transcriptional regulator n=1 Tax=Streptomyces acidiscabies TaxID=42234 RepID=A0AAP6BGS2_9ACTN|nr:helix-turn-helix transcriptional regulator [Streptomyces acidiscabies]MDX2964418.1 helix-turn-helix transcriptional regulator [Streptomyces acidiscabies]MDX3794241.1 helix-turn-helix transcriptional regulator [Streptomyces acidiscabies]
MYNGEDHCAACVRDSRLDTRVQHHVPDLVWRDPEVQAALATWDFGKLSRLIRERAALRQEDMAHMTGLSQGFLSALEAGTRRLRNLDKVASFLEGIETPEALLPPPFREHRAALKQLPLPSPDPPAVDLQGTHGRPTTDLYELAAQAAAESLLFADAATKSNVSEIQLETLESRITRIATDYVHAPLRPLFHDLLSTRDQLFSLLRGHQPPGQTRELYLLAGTSCLLLAHASQNLGDPDAAVAQLQTAGTFAEHADHADLRAWVKGTAALIAEWSTHPYTAIEYTHQATRFTPVGETRIRTAAIRARAAARVGDRNTAEAALRELERAREQQTNPAGLVRFGGLLTFPEAKQEYYIGGTYALLGEHEKAEQHATAAIDLYEAGPKEQRSYGDEALARLDIVTARIATGEIEGAGEQLRPILDLPADRRIRQLGDAVQGVARLLEEPRFARSPVVRELADATRGYQAIDTRAKALTS